MNSKSWIKMVMLIYILMAVAAGGFVVWVDPYFHYHKPIKGMSYPLDNERYQNDGIAKHFDYDAVITGTSMTQNFKSSQMDQLFSVNSIKIPFSGASYREISKNLETVFENNKNVRYVLWGLDYNSFDMERDAMVYESYPEYLYDDLYYNDVNYLFNKEVLMKALCVLEYTRRGKEGTNFDDYATWYQRATPGKEAVLSRYERREKEETKPYDETEEWLVSENIEKNVIQLVQKNPDTKFIIFFPPYSIVFWDNLNQYGGVEKQIMAEKTVIEQLLKCNNVELYSFFENTSLITDLSHYKDTIHYMEDVNEQILNWIHNGEYRITHENYMEYLENNLEFYKNYPYETIFK